jgi:hypothetical protein
MAANAVEQSFAEVGYSLTSHNDVHDDEQTFTPMRTNRYNSHADECQER